MSEENALDNIDPEKLDKLTDLVDFLEGDRFLDPRVEGELEGVLSEEEIIGMYSGEGGTEERIPLIKDFSPDKDKWGGKTNLTFQQARAITLVENLVEAFPVLMPTEALIKSVVNDYEMRLTSVEGLSRNQLTDIYRSMFGGPSTNGEEGRGMINIGLSAGPEGDD